MEDIALIGHHQLELLAKSVVRNETHVRHIHLSVSVEREVACFVALLFQSKEIVFGGVVVLVLMLSRHGETKTIHFGWQLEVRSDRLKLLLCAHKFGKCLAIVLNAFG